MQLPARLTYARFFHSDAASEAFARLLDASFSLLQIQVLCTERGEFEDVRIEHKTEIAARATVCAVLGALVAGTAAVMVAIGVIPTENWGFVATGPVVAAIQGGVAGAAIGGLVGALSGLAYWRKQPALPRGAAARGGILVGLATSPERVHEAETILEGAGGELIVDHQRFVSPFRFPRRAWVLPVSRRALEYAWYRRQRSE